MYVLNEVAGNLRIFCHGWCWKLQSQWQRHNTACSHLAVLWSSAHKYCVITGPGRHKYNIDIISSLATFMKAYTWPQIANIHSADAFPWKDINSFSFWSCDHGIQVGLWLVSFNNKRSDWLAYLDEVEGHAHKLYFFAMGLQLREVDSQLKKFYRTWNLILTLTVIAGEWRAEKSPISTGDWWILTKKQGEHGGWLLGNFLPRAIFGHVTISEPWAGWIEWVFGYVFTRVLQAICLSNLLC